MFVNEDWMWSGCTVICANRRRRGEASPVSPVFSVKCSVCALFWDLWEQSWSSGSSAARRSSNSCRAAFYKTKIGLNCSVSVECIQENLAVTEKKDPMPKVWHGWSFWLMRLMRKQQQVVAGGPEVLLGSADAASWRRITVQPPGPAAVGRIIWLVIKWGVSVLMELFPTGSLSQGPLSVSGSWRTQTAAEMVEKQLLMETRNVGNVV